jgi:transcription initiation factor TFIIB
MDDSFNLFNNNKNVWDCFKEFENKSSLILDESNDSDNEDNNLDNIDENNDYNLSDDNAGFDSKVNDDESYDDISADKILEEFGIIDNIYACLDCKTFTLIYNEGQHICTKCGLVQQKTLSEEAEYRNYSDSNKSTNPERVGMPTNSMLPESSLGTLITHRNHDNTYIKRMVQYNTWHQMPYKERSLYKICCKITAKSKGSGLPNIIIERAKEFYNIIKEVNISRGDNRDGIIAACIYFACKDEKVPRSSKEIANIFGIKLQDMTKGIKNFRETWRVAKSNGDKISTDFSNPIDYIERYCSNLSVPIEVKHISEFIAIKSIMNNLVDDNTAPSIAAGSIFLACSVTGQSITKKQVSEACKTSEVTISKCFKKLNEKKMDLLPISIIKKYNIVSDYE